MNYAAQLPYIKVYSDSKNHVRYVWKSSTSQHGMYEGAIVGETLIDFLLTDLSDYEKRIQEVFYSETDVPNDLDEFTFIMLNAEIYEIAKRLLPLHDIAYFYLFGKLNMVFASDISPFEQIKMAVKTLEDIITLQKIFMDGLAMCCNIDFDSEGVSQSGRFMAFTALHQEFMFYYLLTGTAIAPTQNGKADFEAIDKANTTDKKEQLAMIDKLNPEGANIVSFTVLQSLDEFLYFEFTELLKQGLQVRRCRNCDKYFVLKSKHETFYCDRKVDNNRTCKEIGNKLEYQKKLAKNAILKKYEQIYKAHYAKMMRDEAKEVPMGDEIGVARKCFLQWTAGATDKRRQYVDGTLDEIMFIKAIE